MICLPSVGLSLTRRVLLATTVLPAVSSLPERSPSRPASLPDRAAQPISSAKPQRLFLSSPSQRTCRASAAPAASMSTVTASEGAVVYVTVPDLETGKRIGHALVSDQLAACVNVIPGLTSIYSWEGAVQEDSELLLMIKTTSAAVAELTSRVESMHPYDVPEVIAVPINGGSKPYLNWIEESIRNKPST